MQTPISFPRALCAYLLAVTGAAFFFVLPRFDVATFILCWILTFVAALAPYAGSIAIANRLGIQHWTYFIGGALATAFAFVPLLYYMHPWRSLMRLMPWLALAGAAAGTAAWLVLCYSRRHDENTDSSGLRSDAGRAGPRPSAALARSKA